MPANHYETLGVRQSDTDSSIRRAILAANEKLAADTTLSPAERASLLANIEVAADALSTPANRDRYDHSIAHSQNRATSSRAKTLLLSPLAWIVVFAVSAVAAGLYWQYDREQSRQRIERERVAADLKEERRIQEMEARRVAEKQKLLEELREQRDADDKLRQAFNQTGSAESQKRTYTVDERHVPPPPTNYSTNYETANRNYQDQRQLSNDAMRRAYEEGIQRYEDDMNVQRARAEVARQKRYLEQLEREEEAARAARDPASRQPRK